MWHATSPGSMADPWRERIRAATASVFPGTHAERWAFVVLLAVAAVLRFWGFPSIPYTHDEISALVRVDYGTLGEAISKGVVGVDTHPPGTHAFLWAWTQLFGFGDGAVKAPFILMSLAAIFFLYRFSYAWAGGPVAVITTALLACFQYTVMYGQIARPYAMGFFTTALLADQLTRYLARSRRAALLLIVLSAVVSAYTHHFALMLAVFMCTTGLALGDDRQRKELVLACAGAALLYAPNLPLFYAQLQWKGLGEWLTAPLPDWLPGYAWWIAHCSIAFAAVLVGALGLALALAIKHRSISWPLLWITVIWGLLPLVIGYAYSVWRAPVLQYSVVLFSFPYLLIGALSGLRWLQPVQGFSLAGVCLTIGTFSLVQDRDHFAVTGTSKYEDTVRGTLAADTLGALAVVDVPDEVMRFYRTLWCITPSQAPYFNLRYRAPGTLDSLLATTTATRIFYGQTTHGDPENVQRIQARFPFLMERKDRAEGQTYLFSSKREDALIEDNALKSLITPQAIGSDAWTFEPSIKLWSDTANAPFYSQQRWDMTAHEFGILYERPIDTLVASSNDVIEIRADVDRVGPDSDLRLVAEIKDGDSTIFYRLNSVRTLPQGQPQISLFTAVKLADLPGHGKGLNLRAYLHNPEGRMAMVSALSVRVRQGDPVLYGFFAPIQGPWTYR